MSKSRHVGSGSSSDFDDSSNEDFVDKEAPEDDNSKDFSLIDEFDFGKRLENRAL